ncbi:Alpha/Beta hydrolase protein, partial [Xylariales sp. PMI_506]
ADAAATVTHTGKAPTGYEVKFTYANASASSVILSGVNMFTDEKHTSPQRAAAYSPFNYQPGYFVVENLVGAGQNTTDWPFVLQKTNGSDDGLWALTVPLPAGTYSYSFCVNEQSTANCSVDNSNVFVDPENPPFVNVPGDMTYSIVQVPYDAQFQEYRTLDLNFNFTLPVASNSSRGTLKAVNYTSPGSTHPAPDVHDYVVYLPPGYSNSSCREYPVLYISHGGGGDAYEWPNLGKVDHILDRLIDEGLMEPSVAIMPSFYSLNSSWGSALVYGSSAVTPGLSTLDLVRENFMEYLFPHVEATYAVSRNASRRAFCGMSKGASLSYEMYINATDYFSYFGQFSGAFGLDIPPLADYVNATQLAANPRLGEVGMFLSFGLYDRAFTDMRNLQEAMDDLSLGYIVRSVPYGAHYWNTWQDALWHFGKEALWRPFPF